MGCTKYCYQGSQAECCRSLPLRLIAACSSLLFVLLPILFYFLGKYELVNYPTDCLVSVTGAWWSTVVGVPWLPPICISGMTSLGTQAYLAMEVNWYCTVRRVTKCSTRAAMLGWWLAGNCPWTWLAKDHKNWNILVQGYRQQMMYTAQLTNKNKI